MHKTYTVETHWYFVKDRYGGFQGKEVPKNISGLITLQLYTAIYSYAI